MVKLSVVISAYNEEKNIRDCLESIRWADEIVFIDNASQDKTLEIAKKYTKKTFVRPNNLMLNVNKNFGFEKATGDWILSLDADERVSPELREEIKSILDQDIEKIEINGYRIPRKNIIFGKWIQHTGWYPDYQMRLFRRDKGRFAENHVHEQLTVTGETASLAESILHLNYTSVSQFIYKMTQIYVPNEAKNLSEGGKKVVWQDTIRMPTAEFFRRFFADEGWRDGLHGLILSLFMAFYHLLIFATLWEKQGFYEAEEDFFKSTQVELKQVGKDFRHWLITTQINRRTNGMGKLFLRIKRKIF